MPPVEEGRKRAFVDLQERHYQYLQRYAVGLTADKRRPCTISDALEHIVRHTMMLDQTKAGQFVNAATVPAVKA
jgi:DNA-directed RNA polymerase specialized sigma24 family protein